MIPIKDKYKKFDTDPTLEDQTRIHKTKKSILDRPSEPLAQRIEAKVSHYFTQGVAGLQTPATPLTVCLLTAAVYVDNPSIRHKCQSHPSRRIVAVIIKSSLEGIKEFISFSRVLIQKGT